MPSPSRPMAPCWRAAGRHDLGLEPQDRESLGILEGHKSPVWSLSFSQPGVLASGSADRTAKLWHFGSGKRPRELVTSWSATRPIRATVYAPDGSVLAVATTDNNVFIRDAKTGDVVKTLHGHTAQINCLGFSADGKMLASGSDDQTVKLWDWAAGEELHTLTGHDDAVHAVTFLADGKQLASAGDDKTTASGRSGRRNKHLFWKGTMGRSVPWRSQPMAECLPAAGRTARSRSGTSNSGPCAARCRAMTTRCAPGVFATGLLASGE